MSILRLMPEARINGSTSAISHLQWLLVLLAKMSARPRLSLVANGDILGGVIETVFFVFP
jgi:hypothetical protein